MLYLKRLFCLIGNYLPPPLNKYFYYLAGVKFSPSKVWIGNQCYLDTVRPDLITIENETCISFRVIIITHFDPSESIKNHFIKNYFKPVNIKSGTFIGPGSIINPGVTIGENSFVKSGSIIFKDIPPHTMVDQNSMKTISKIDQKE